MCCISVCLESGEVYSQVNRVTQKKWRYTYAIYSSTRIIERVRNVRSHDQNPSSEANIRVINSGVRSSADWYAGLPGLVKGMGVVVM